MNTQSYISFSVLSKEKFDFLADYRDLYCITIYLPKSLKNENPLGHIEKKLIKKSQKKQFTKTAQGLTTFSIHRHLKDIKQVIASWQEEKKEIVGNILLFISEEYFETFEVPFQPPFKIYINDHFYLKLAAQLHNNNHEPIFSIVQSQKVKLSSQLKEKHYITTDVDEIIKHSANGKVKALFLEKGKDEYGEFDRENNFVLTHGKESNATSLSNIAAINTIQNDGNVYILDNELMPFPEKAMNAIINV